MKTERGLLILILAGVAVLIYLFVQAKQDIKNKKWSDFL